MVEWTYHTKDFFFMTICDISKALGISIATVSKALNGSSDISDGTKKTICDYADSVGYRSRKSRSVSGRLALLSGRQYACFAPLREIALSFRTAAEEARYIVVEDRIDTDDFDLDDYLAANRFYGAMLLGIDENTPAYRRLKRTSYPVVVADNFLTENPHVAGVGSDILHGTQAAVEYLLSLGHERIAFVGEENSLVLAERFAGYLHGLMNAGLPIRGEDLFFGEGGTERAAEAEGYTAAVCCSDKSALLLIHLIQQKGKRVPEDISVIGADDCCNHSGDPRLTAVRQNFTEIGKLGFRMLEHLMKGQPAQRAMIGCTLIPGESSCPLSRIE